MLSNIIVDSGAFSAWTKEKEVDLDEYISFIKRFEEDLTSYVNLDVIPGKPGRKPTSKEIDFSANAGWENYLKMIDSGLRPIPVFHFGEDIKWLRRIVDSGVDYIGLGGVVGRPRPLVKKWLDKIFSMITDKEGYPIVKVHGFGVTSTFYISRYPWYSIDSISWKLTAGLGRVLIPPFDDMNDCYNYFKAPHSISFSDKSSQKTLEGKHYKTTAAISRQALMTYVTKNGYKEEELIKCYNARGSLNGLFFQNAVMNIPVGTFKSKSMFFKKEKIKKDKIPEWGNTIFYFGVKPSREIAQLSRSVDNISMLISYGEYIATFKHIKDDYFKKYKEAAIKEKNIE